MKIGVLFPQTEIGSDPAGLRDYAQAVQELGFSHLVSYEHILGAVPERLPPDYAPFGIHDEFNEVLTTFAYLTACAPGLGLATGILVLPQRQTPLVAKQTCQLQWLTQGNFRLGVGLGWNFAEFEGLGRTFSNRARRMEEQIRLLRQLWSQEVVHFQGEFESVEGCGILPLPPQPIPIWIGGRAQAALRRAATLGDGLFPLSPLEGGWKATLEQVRQWREEAGKPWEGFGIEARVTIQPGWQEELQQWQELGATHIYLATMGKGVLGPAAHIEFLQQIRKDGPF